ncbi:MAG: CatB-related O-acetyltransferase [Roseibium sp.]|uniref:CatB-related O-acetyltransferase n=1 Tax=Roseibium sp. TaxID=1936156 RepID=UPI001B09560D|nr:CatB-related O-acetyltransferase [Roseibium sp.]MBO6509070.1 CatB-related O-acetyltransferase [Roseibium sp.]MBO6890413.1 CatB-related O-acetyltransferase [Roseibium sp.]MBO6929146.1 CatB-related O-acetyltransferase [Roseibium sp.]
MHAPSPDTTHPFNGEPHTVFLKNVITRPTIEVGDYSYYNDENHAADFENRNVRYHFDFVGDRLKIGKFCALASGTTFIMNGANHAMTGFSTYPFNIFGDAWREGFDPDTIFKHLRGDTVVRHDVWFGTNSTVMPGVTICSGAIIGANTVVSCDVPPYAIVVGNPGRVVRLRFEESVIERLLDIAWWHWPVERITRNLAAIRGAEIDALERAAEESNDGLDVTAKSG